MANCKRTFRSLRAAPIPLPPPGARRTGRIVSGSFVPGGRHLATFSLFSQGLHQAVNSVLASAKFLVQSDLLRVSDSEFEDSSAIIAILGRAAG